MRKTILIITAVVIVLSLGLFQAIPASACDVYQGCTPAFWKSHTNLWNHYSTNTRLEAVFDIPNRYSSLQNYTMKKALTTTVQGSNNKTLVAARSLMRQAVAALLNARHPDINYPISEQEIKTMVKKSLLTRNRASILKARNTLAEYNNLGYSDDSTFYVRYVSACN